MVLKRMKAVGTALTPHGLLRFFAWQARFKAVGFDDVSAWRSAASRSMREALLVSRIELLPATMRSRLSLVIDVGANIGQWASALRKFVTIERLEVFEPNPSAFQELEALFGQIPGVSLHNKALGESPRNQTLHITRGPTLSSLLTPLESLKLWHGTGAEVVNQLSVPITTLDEAFPGVIVVDLLKIDTQGFERYVLRGGTDVLKRTRALLIELDFESHYKGDCTFGALFDFITNELGFRFWDMTPPERADGRAEWVDIVFVNPTMAVAKSVDCQESMIE